MPGPPRVGTRSLRELARTLALASIALQQAAFARVVKDPRLLVVGDEVAPGAIGDDRDGKHEIVVARLLEYDRVAYHDGGLGVEADRGDAGDAEAEGRQRHERRHAGGRARFGAAGTVNGVHSGSSDRMTTRVFVHIVDTLEGRLRFRNDGRDMDKSW